MTNIFFGDFETLSLDDLPKTGAYHYAKHPSTDILVLGGAYLGDRSGFIWSPGWAWGNAPGCRADDEHHLEQLFDHINEGGMTAWWNAGFDRRIWNEVAVRLYGWPVLPLEQVICVQAQAEANNLPGKLEKACECLGTPYQKDPKGTTLIKELSVGRTRDMWDSAEFETPEKMGHFRSYCLKDVLSTRDVYEYTRPLMSWEWDEYRASERINDRGVMVDVGFAHAATKYASAEAAEIDRHLVELTGDPDFKITQHLRKAAWLHAALECDPELQQITERPPKDDKPRYSCDRPTRETVLDRLAEPEHAERFDPDHLADVIEFLELIEAGNSAAVNKFRAMCNQEVNGRIHGMYAFNGAGQTGRFSSRGVQTHNMIRDPLEKGNPDRAIDAIEDILDGAHPDDLVEDYGYPISRLLARLIRPSFMAAPRKTLVWGDWAQIEGRVLPWLSDSNGGDDKLAIFAEGRDVYSETAASILHKPDINDFERQVFGKVPELALGFGGSTGAFAAMGRGYGVSLPANEIKPIVDRWRAANQWCVDYWFELWNAAMAAYSHPGNWYVAGRVKYMFHPQLMRGTLICQLPCGRWIVYPRFRHEQVVVEDEEGRERVVWLTTCVRGFGGGFGRVKIWHGTLAENITQGTAASILRYALTYLDKAAVLHTHDEVVMEVDQSEAEAAAIWLRNIMESGPDWAEGLPLEADIESGPYYTK